jgi:Carboxypeptidase regulatory-like domain
MLRAVSVLCLLWSILCCWTASACECEASFATCKEVKLSDLVFIGTVESIEPIFLSRWYGANQSAMRSLNDAFVHAQEHPSAESLHQVQDMYLAMFPGLDDREKKQVKAADTVQQMTSMLYSSLDRGMRVHFKVKTLFKQGDDDDNAATKAGGKDQKDKDDDDDRKSKTDFMDVWTTAGDCGYDFQIGETYLVFANDEEGADYYFTSSCMRTKRLSDAGEDLAYLYFYKNQPAESSRLEGFATSDRKSQLAIDPLHEPAAIGSPVAGVVLQLKSDKLTRYAESESAGRFIFDGLPEGSYELSVFASGYPKTNQLLAGPRRLLVKEKSCVRQVFVLPKTGG